VGSRPTAALDAAEATRADVSGDETEDHAVVYMTTLTCGATLSMVQSTFNLKGTGIVVRSRQEVQ